MPANDLKASMLTLIVLMFANSVCLVARAEESESVSIQSSTTLEVVLDFDLAAKEIAAKYRRSSMFGLPKEAFIQQALLRCDDRLNLPTTVKAVDRGILRKDEVFILESFVKGAPEQSIAQGTSFWAQSPSGVIFSRIDAPAPSMNFVSPYESEYFRVLASSANYFMAMQCRNVAGSESVLTISTPWISDIKHPLMTREFYQKWISVSSQLKSEQDSDRQVSLFIQTALDTEMVPVWIERGCLKFPNECTVELHKSAQKLRDQSQIRELGKSTVEVFYPSVGKHWIQILENSPLPPEVSTYLIAIKVGAKRMLLGCSTKCPFPLIVDAEIFAELSENPK